MTLGIDKGLKQKKGQESDDKKEKRTKQICSWNREEFEVCSESIKTSSKDSQMKPMKQIKEN